MSIMSFIEKQKTEFRERQNKRDAKELQKLRKIRITEEGRARLIKLKEKEKKRISKAKETRIEDLKRRFGAPATVKKSRAIPKKDNKLGNGFGQGINPAFGIGREK